MCFSRPAPPPPPPAPVVLPKAPEIPNIVSESLTQAGPRAAGNKSFMRRGKRALVIARTGE